VSSEVSEFRSPHCKSGHESPSAAVDAWEMWCYPRTKTSRSRTQLQLDQIVRLMLETYLGTRVSVFRCFGVSPRMKRADMVCMCEVQVVSRPSDVEVKILVLRHLASLHHYCKACMSRRMLDIYARSYLPRKSPRARPSSLTTTDTAAMQCCPTLLSSSLRSVTPKLQPRAACEPRSFVRRLATKVAVLYQATPPPLINGVRKPMKPGGYQDSGADIAFNLQNKCGLAVSTPKDMPDPAQQADWCFPDTEEGTLAALDTGATHLWANTILFAGHALQSSQKVRAFQDQFRVVGQPPSLVELYDDKRYVNDWLRDTGDFTMPRGWTLTKSSSDVASQLAALDLPYPVVAKPCRGRGSAGVKVCHTPEELAEHVASLYEDSSTVMLEEYLAGVEATVTVMPPSDRSDAYWALPIVARFNHVDGVAPYNGSVAVTSNSRVLGPDEVAADKAYRDVARECEAAAQLMRVTAPIRVDVRRREDAPASPFVLFDVNMKPVG
jgi:hypothetical protein